MPELAQLLLLRLLDRRVSSSLLWLPFRLLELMEVKVRVPLIMQLLILNVQSQLRVTTFLLFSLLVSRGLVVGD